MGRPGIPVRRAVFSALLALTLAITLTACKAEEIEENRIIPAEYGEMEVTAVTDHAGWVGPDSHHKKQLRELLAELRPQHGPGHIQDGGLVLHVGQEPKLSGGRSFTAAGK